MDRHISLSKREKRYQFLYLLGMLLLILIVLGAIIFRKNISPFSNSSDLEIQMLSQKNRFAKQQEIVAPLVENTFTKISVLKMETIQPFAEKDIENSINDVANAFSNVEVYDTRKESYLQIAQFYKMFFEDKKIAAKKTENIKLFQQEFEECSIGFKDKEQQLSQKKDAILSRNNNSEQ